jgi:hypothetical protein
MGMKVLPCKPSGEQNKAPLIRNGFKAASADTGQIRSWWQQWPNALIGVAIPDHYIVLDIDPRNGASIEALEAVTGPLPETLTSWSGRGDGGRHLWFHKPAQEISSRQLPKGVDLKAGGKGYVIVPPSLHPATGKPYVWTGTSVAELPVSAIDALAPRKPPVTLPAPVSEHPGNLNGLVRSVAEAVEGERNAKLYWAACRAFDHGNDDIIQDLFEAALSVGLTESEASSTIDSARRTERQQPEPFVPRGEIPHTSPILETQNNRSDDIPTNWNSPDSDNSPDFANPQNEESDSSVESGNAPGSITDAEPLATWQPLDLTQYVDGTFKPAQPSLMTRDDGVGLLYPGLVHSLNGESESGKSMIAIGETSIQLKAGHRVLFLDYESDPATVVDRLLKMGTPKNAITEHLHYAQPEVDPVTSTVHELHQWQQILSTEYTLAVIDGVTEALGTSSASSMDNDEVAHWMRKVPRAIADHTGAATLLIDHVTKSRDTRGRFAIGAQSKLSSLSGAAYMVEPLEPIGVGMTGRLQVKVAKDRPGQVRAHSVGWDKTDRLAIIAEAVIDSTDPAQIIYRLEAPTPPPAPTDPLDEIQEKILQSIKTLQQDAPPSWNKIRNDVSGRNEVKRQALDQLIDAGKVIVTSGPNRSKLHTVPGSPVPVVPVVPPIGGGTTGQPTGPKPQLSRGQPGTTGDNPESETP